MNEMGDFEGGIEGSREVNTVSKYKGHCFFSFLFM